VVDRCEEKLRDEAARDESYFSILAAMPVLAVVVGFYGTHGRGSEKKIFIHVARGK